MALSFGENLGVLGNIKLTDVKLVAGAFRTIPSGSSTGSITVQRVEDGQIICTGFNKNGLLLAPPCAKWVANEIKNNCS